VPGDFALGVGGDPEPDAAIDAPVVATTHAAPLLVVVELEPRESVNVDMDTSGCVGDDVADDVALLLFVALVVVLIVVATLPAVAGAAAAGVGMEAAGRTRSTAMPSDVRLAVISENTATCAALNSVCRAQ
jgi:hypothetical protein